MRILFLGVVLYGILASLGPPRARACSPLALSDWKGYRANVLDGETDVPVDLKLRLVLERIGDITSVFDPEAFVMTCDGTTVAGTWQASVSAEHWTEAALWAVPEIRQRDGVWSSSVGCAAAACVVNGKVYLRALFEPAASLPPGALCEVWLQEPCAEPGCSIPPLPNTYPMQVLTFTTGMADTPDALDLGEPQARALLYPQDIQECGYLEPQNPGSCPTCVTQETVTRLGVVFTFPSTLPEERELFALVYRADSSEGLSASSATTLWLSALDSLSQAGFAVDLRAKGDPPRCVQIAIEDRRGRRSPRSAPFCVDPGDMPWPSSGCGCGAGVEGMTGLGAGGGLGLGMALMVILLLFFRRRR